MKRRSGKASSLPKFLRERKPTTFSFRDDGKTPNNPRLPLILYRSAVAFPEGLEPQAVLEVLFASNGWANSWRNGIYDFQHFHTRTHEVLGIAKGRARILFGGERGRIIPVKSGDVIVVPAGTGHRRRFVSRDLVVVGAYPPGGAYDEPKPDAIDHARAIASIGRVKVPERDPVYGIAGGMLTLWGRR